MYVPMLDLKDQYHNLKEEIHKALQSVMENASFILGKNVKKLEEDVARLSCVKHGIGVANGSDAIHLALLGCGVEAGDEVITTAFTFFATAGAIARIGAIPVFADIDPITFNIDPNRVEAKISKHTKAVLPVHLYGQMADMGRLKAIADNHKLAIVEDAAQAIGASFQGRSPGELGDVATYSFFPTKNLGAYGDGGMVVTNDDEIAEKIRVLRVHGSKPKYYHHVLGYNSRLDELQAAILNVKFPLLQRWAELRQEKATNYSRLLSRLEGIVGTPTIAKERNHVFHQYTIRAKKRDELQAFLKGNGIETMVYYPKPLHLQPVFEYLGYREGDLPETEAACKEALSLPMYPELTLDQQEYVCERIIAFYEESL